VYITSKSDLGVRYTVHPWLIGWLPISANWTFFNSSYSWADIGQNCCVRKGGGWI